MNTEAPRIYCACLAAYNNGKLHGTWIDATQDADDIMAEIEAMLAQSPEPDAEDRAIHDHEYFWGYPVSEHKDLEELSEIAQAIAEHGAAYAAYASLIDDITNNLPSPEHFEDCFKGKWESEKDFALKSDEVEEMCGWNNVPEWWRHHIDWQSVADLLFMDDYCSIDVNGFDSNSYGIYVFKIN